MSYTVYTHTSPCGKVYVGITSMKLKDRWKNGNGYETCTLLKRAIEKYGWENFTHEVIFEGLTKEEAEIKERELIASLRSNDPEYGYNIENGGYTHGKHSPQTLKKMSENRKGKCVGIDNPFYHKSHSKEWIQNHLCGENNPMYGVRGKNHPRYGIKHTKESIQKMKDSKKGKYAGVDNPKARKVRCIETGEVFDCIKYASEKTGAHISCISAVIHGRAKTAGGYHWEMIA